MPTVLITHRTLPEHLEPLRGVAEILNGLDDGRLMPRAEVLRLAPQLDAIINQGELRVDAGLLDAAPRLKIVANAAMGTNNLDLPLMAQRGVWATNTPDAFTDATADATFALLLALARRVVEVDRYVRSGRWAADGFQPSAWDGLLLSGKTLGIVGYGQIGQAVAKRALAFGMNVIFHTQRPREDAAYRALDALLAEADVVSLHVPLTDATRHLINAARLARMKRGALLVNMARGPVVDEAALVAALQSGQLGGAALDVFEDEPRVTPTLLTMPNVVLTPHLGGGTRESRRAARLLCAENVARVLRGQPPLTSVNHPLA